MWLSPSSRTPSRATRTTRRCVSFSRRRIVRRSSCSSARTRDDMKRLLIVITLAARSALGQSVADGPILQAHGLDSTGSVNLYVPAGSVRLVAWDRDSLVVRGEKAKNAQLFFGATRRGVKMGVESASSGDSEP